MRERLHFASLPELLRNACMHGAQGGTWENSSWPSLAVMAEGLLTTGGAVTTQASDACSGESASKMEIVLNCWGRHLENR